MRKLCLELFERQQTERDDKIYILEYDNLHRRTKMSKTVGCREKGVPSRSREGRDRSAHLGRVHPAEA
ncbi:MAG: hypothetical protein KGY66_03590 [Candidatus Thermoplasmatota archaeon]|nr:hypothetical protein [Candidatus Thermoplasmatota archaeon]MBS3789979.1 hypothetical protein [Candidatus Thermoplasmatota archaeon]